MGTSELIVAPGGEVGSHFSFISTGHSGQTESNSFTFETNELSRSLLCEIGKTILLLPCCDSGEAVLGMLPGE